MTELRPVRDEQELRAAMALRREVFVVEQQVPEELEVDEHDHGALHLVAVEDGAVVATCRLVASGDTVKLGRMAVAAGARRRGLASRLLAEAEDQARARGMRRVALAAQTDALGLYERAGYSGYGERFMEAGLEHLMMEKRLWGRPAQPAGQGRPEADRPCQDAGRDDPRRRPAQPAGQGRPEADRPCQDAGRDDPRR